MDDLQESIHIKQAAVDATPEDHPNRANRLNNLEVGFSERYGRTGLINDLQESIHIKQAAVDATPEDHPDQAHHLNSLGAGHNAQYWRTGSMNDLQQALVYFTKSLRQSNSPPLERFEGGREAADITIEIQKWGSGARYLAESLDLLPRIVPRPNSNNDLQYILCQLSGLGPLTASIFLRAGKSALESLQALEKCRGVISSLIIDSKSDVSLLKKRPLGLWSRYCRLREVVAASASSRDRSSFTSKLPLAGNYTLISL